MLVGACLLLQSAERLLSEALGQLRTPGQIGSSGALLQQPDSPAADPQSPQQQTAGTLHFPEQTGQMTQYARNVGSVLGSIASVGLAPGPAGSAGNLCVAVNSTQSAQLDLYVGCQEKQLERQSLDKQVCVNRWKQVCVCKRACRGWSACASVRLEAAAELRKTSSVFTCCTGRDCHAVDTSVLFTCCCCYCLRAEGGVHGS